ncbi:MAG: response regulator transcription factor [Pseudomonadota bacterium]
MDSTGTGIIIKVVVAEDNDDLRALIAPLINEEPDMVCAATTAFLDEVSPLIVLHQAHVAVLDMQLRGGSALPRLPALCRDHPATRFIMHSGHSNPELIRKARDAGAGAYVLKSGDIDELIVAIRKLMAQ